MLPGVFPNRVVPALLAILSSAVLFWFGNGLEPWWPLMWFAPLPVLIFAAADPSRRRAACVAFATLFLGGASMFGYFRVLGAPWGWFVTYAAVSAVFTGSVLLFRARLRAGAPWSALLAFPVTMVTCEYLIGFTPGGSAGSLANTQLACLPFLQLASVTGPYGITFVLLMFSASLAIAWHLRRTAPKQAAFILGVAVDVVGLIIIFGVVRLAQSAPAPTIKVGLVASDIQTNTLPPETWEDTGRLFREYSVAVRGLAARGAQIVILPEKIGAAKDANPPAGDADADTVFQAVADQAGVAVAVGLIHLAPDFKSNQARVYEPHTSPLRYDKRHLLPSFEGKMRPGATLGLLPKPGAPWGVAICKDMDHPGYICGYGQAGVGLMLVPAWDFGVDRGWHGHIAVMRGVENGCAVARSAKLGYLYVSDDRGRILSEVRSDSAPFATLLADAPTRHESTIYSRFGDWFAWLAVTVFVGLVVQQVGTAVPRRP